MVEFFVRDAATADLAVKDGADGDKAVCLSWALRNRVQIAWHLRGVAARAVVMGQEEETSWAVNSFAGRLAEVVRLPGFSQLSCEEHKALPLTKGAARLSIPYTFWIVFIDTLPHAIAADNLEALVCAVHEAVYEARR